MPIVLPQPVYTRTSLETSHAGPLIPRRAYYVVIRWSHLARAGGIPHQRKGGRVIVACGDDGAVAGAVSNEGCILPIARNRSMASIILWVGTPSTHAEAFPFS